MRTIRWCSEDNPWMDVIIIVPERLAKIAYDATLAAYESYWNEEFECYGDALYTKLKAAGVFPYWTVFHDSDRTDDEYENEWNKIVDGISAFAPRYEWAIGPGYCEGSATERKILN